MLEPLKETDPVTSPEREIVLAFVSAAAVPVVFALIVAGRLSVTVPELELTSISFAVPVNELTNVSLLIILDQSTFASNSPAVPEYTSLVFVALGIKVNFPVESSKPKKPNLAAVPLCHLNSIPLSLLSSEVGFVLPPSVNTGSLT